MPLVNIFGFHEISSEIASYALHFGRICIRIILIFIIGINIERLHL